MKDLVVSDAAIPRTTGRRWVAWLLLALAAGAMMWAAREAILGEVGELLIAEDAVQRVDVMVISKASVAADSLEVGRLYGECYGHEIIMGAWRADNAVVPAIRELGVPFLDESDLATEILRRSGVPDTAVRVLPANVDGTESEIAAVAAYARERQPASLLFVTARSHTARARSLLRDALPTTTRLLVRAPRTDSFRGDAWWRSRDDSREVCTEYLRWFNTLVLRDPWGR